MILFEGGGENDYGRRVTRVPCRPSILLVLASAYAIHFAIGPEPQHRNMYLARSAQTKWHKHRGSKNSKIYSAIMLDIPDFEFSDSRTVNILESDLRHHQMRKMIAIQVRPIKYEPHSSEFFKPLVRVPRVVVRKHGSVEPPLATLKPAFESTCAIPPWPRGQGPETLPPAGLSTFQTLTAR